MFPEWYPDYEYKKHTAMTGALDVLDRTFEEFKGHSGRAYSAVEPFDCDDAEIILLGLGSMMQTARWTAAQMRAQGRRVGVLNVRVYRPFPDRAVRDALAKAKHVVVLDRDIGYGTSGMVFPDVTRVLYPLAERPQVINCIIGTGGKDITPQTIERCVELAEEAHENQTVFWPDARGPKEGIPYSTASLPV